MAKIYKKGEKYYYRDGNKLYSCELQDNGYAIIYSPHSQSDPEYEEYTIDSNHQPDENSSKVHYNKVIPQNYISITFTVTNNIYNYTCTDMGADFDNGQDSIYYISGIDGNGQEVNEVWHGGPLWSPYSKRKFLYTGERVGGCDAVLRHYNDNEGAFPNGWDWDRGVTC